MAFVIGRTIFDSQESPPVPVAIDLAPANTPLLRRFCDSRSGACTYLIGSADEVALIDPVRDHVSLYLGVIEELGCRLKLVLETHLHADHLSAAASLRELTGARVIAPRDSTIENADLLVGDGAHLELGSTVIDVLATPGHTPSALTYRWGDRLFTGDTLLIGDCGRCDEPGGNAGQLYDSLYRKLLPLADELLVYPGHDREERWVSCIGEERRRNPLFRGLSRDEFISRCNQAREPLPTDLFDNLAANRRCGRVD